MSVGTRLRFSLIDGPELRCAHCGDWWAINTEAWVPGSWDRCRACHNERSRLYQALRRKDPAFRAIGVERNRRYRAWIKREAPGYLEAYDRERRAIARDRLRAYRHGKAA